MKDILEIIFHSRAGQGALTIADLLARTALEAGNYIQAFPEYGADRGGAPMQVFVRISKKPINLYFNIRKPDIIVVLDDTLLDKIPLSDSFRKKGILVINSSQKKELLRKKFNFKGRLLILDAFKIALEELSQPITNTTILGALVQVIPQVSFEAIKKFLKERFTLNYGEEIMEKNLRAFERGYKEIKNSKLKIKNGAI